MESNIIIPTFTVLLKNGVLNKRFQEKFMLTLLQKRKRMNSKKDPQDSCGYTPRTERLCHSIFRRIFLLLRYSGKTCLDRQGKKTRSKDNRFARTLPFVWSRKHGPKTAIQTGRTINSTPKPSLTF